ncbi:alpha/beta fold hydrolase [Actinoplanes sp. NPDC049668]|uniref:alpha/beta fold hydrolase n=1 Tax=unclassified Actinoplanes TaxID=2626549 RepID=UPI0033AE7AEF
MRGYAEHDGVRIAYRVLGDSNEPTVVLMPTWPIVDSQHWKAQVPYLSRLFRVVTYDPPGNGASDRPLDPAAYGDNAQVGQLLAVLAETGTERAVLAGLCSGAWLALVAAARHPDRVAGVAAIGPAGPFLAPPRPERTVYDFDAELDTDEGWAKCNRHYWRRDYPGFARFFFDTVINDPHSSKLREDAVGWAAQTTPEVLIASMGAELCVADRDSAERLLRAVRCPVLVIRGSEDRCRPVGQMTGIAELTGARDVVLEGAGHLPHARWPVEVNHLLRDLIRPPAPAPAPPRRGRAERVLYLSSPIGLGHVERDVAVVEALRREHPGLEVDWLAQHPITEVLTRRGERVHPASRYLASEAAHVDAEAGVHDLHAFQAVRRMDAILVANFMLFADLVENEHYDLWVGDEAWELDHFLHENPKLKRAPYAWLTDFVGWLPMPGGGAAEAGLTADYNAEMIEHVARWPRLRDRAIFVGNPTDLVEDPLGPGLPSVREWTMSHFDFSGYIGPPPAAAPREELLCVATVGGSGTGEDLLRRVIAAFPLARRALPGLRMIVVAGPRIDRARLGGHEGLEIRGYVDRLDRLLASCDLAITHGGLSTTMTLTAYRRPFLYVPLRNHFEQNRHVRHRLDAYRAGRCLDWADTEPEALAAAIVAEIGRPVDYRPVETDGAERAARLLAELI